MQGGSEWNEQEQIGGFLKAARKNLGLTMLELAARTGLSQGAISMIENGVRQASPSTLSSIASALNIELPEHLSLNSKSGLEDPEAFEIQVLGFKLVFEPKSFASEFQDSSLNATVKQAMTRAVVEELRQSRIQAEVADAVKEALRQEAERKQKEMDKIYGIIEE